jgi:hypothetical protein
MRRYYFDCEVDGKPAEDEEGLQLSSLDAVEKEALHSTAAIACDEFPSHGGNGLVVVRVRDDQGSLVLTTKCLMTTTMEWSVSTKHRSGQ